ncbi:hypothetical protein MTP99_017624 [Tenebrio molitor]|jgi:hypothetical protein|nr:hypothetical protein MTP99_017624 [Tenebrio molitor]
MGACGECGVIDFAKFDRDLMAEDAKMVADVTSDRRTAAEVLADYLRQNKGKKLTDEDVKMLVKGAFQGCDLVYSEAEGASGSGENDKIDK